MMVLEYLECDLLFCSIENRSTMKKWEETRTMALSDGGRDAPIFLQKTAAG
jgi:hypothetical protein